jgi:hypothetical protein
MELEKPLVTKKIKKNKIKKNKKNSDSELELE